MKLLKIEKLIQGCLQQVDQRVNLTITFLSEIFYIFIENYDKSKYFKKKSHSY